MLIRYVGPSKEVQIAVTGQTCRRGEAVEVGEPLAVSLLEQSDIWELVDLVEDALVEDPEEE